MVTSVEIISLGVCDFHGLNPLKHYFRPASGLDQDCLADMLNSRSVTLSYFSASPASFAS